MRLHHEILGQGPPLIVLHGMLGSLANWRSVARALADIRTVILADLRNHGRSPHDEHMALPVMAADVVELMRLLGHARTDLLGHSLGGKVAMRVALDEPERVARLIVADISPRATPVAADEPLQAALELDLRSVPSREAAVVALARRLGSESLARWLAMNIERDSEGGIGWRVPLEILQRSRPELVAAVDGGRFDGPALFLRGDRSTFLPEEDRPLIRALFPSSTITAVSNAGHWLHADAFEEVVARLREFLT